MKILVFGGSFDPPHLGHLELLKAGLKAVRPDLAYIIPARLSPLKKMHHAPVPDRLRMIELFRVALPALWRRRVRVERFELARVRPSFTIDTLMALRRRHPDADFCFLLGSDSFVTLPRWRQWRKLDRLCQWVVGRRRDSPSKTKIGLPARQMLRGRFPPISSTQIRSRILAGLPWSKLVLPRVVRYVIGRRLYALPIHEELKRTLKPGRYEHTLAVAGLALDMAERHGLDAEAAALAGLLHDAGRRFDPAEMTRYVRAHRLNVPAGRQVALRAPLLQHAFISEDLARRRFGVEDPKTLCAIRNHTLGAVGMSPLERLLYIADSASADRRHAEATRIRRVAERNLDLAFKQAVRVKMRYARQDGSWMHPGTARFVRWSASL